jgi:hypothetical protein
MTPEEIAPYRGKCQRCNRDSQHMTIVKTPAEWLCALCLADALAASEQRVRELRDALAHYARPEIYEPDSTGMSPIDFDGGETARVILAVLASPGSPQEKGKETPNASV